MSLGTSSIVSRSAQVPLAGLSTHAPPTVFRPPSHVLVVEDDENDAILLNKAFAEIAESIPLSFVEDGEQAVNYLKGAGRFADRKAFPVPTLLILDLKLPRLNGFDVLRWVRNQPDFIRLPVIILSGSMWPDDVDEAYRLGANSYLVKPLIHAELNEMVRSATLYWFNNSIRLPINGAVASV